MALLRLNGVSIFWLILIHGVFDCVNGVVGKGVDVEMIPSHDLLLLTIAVGLIIYLRKNRGTVLGSIAA